MVGRITIVGLGPAGAEFIIPAGLGALEACEHRYARTARHPAIDDLALRGVTFDSFDRHYETLDRLDNVYAAIVGDLVASAETLGEIVYAVPGNPVVAEQTVRLLKARDDVTVQIIPGLSFADLAWAHVGVDPLDGARVVDAHAFAVEAAGAHGALLIAQCDSVLLLSDVKLALLESLDGDHDVTVLQRLGLATELVQTIALQDLDRVVVPDHLTSVFVETKNVAISGEFERLWQLTLQLRGPGGCPWDAEQTHHSLARHTLEEAYEVVEAIERLPVDAPNGDEEPAVGAYEKLEDELGDLLFQVMIHSALALEAGAFTPADVARTVHAKLVHRHPHVFGDTSVANADEVVKNWETIKKAEQGHASLVDGLPDALPALLYVPKLYRKLKAVGLDPAALDPAAELGHALRILETTEHRGVERAIGAVLGALVAVARAHDVDPESALRGYAARMKDDFRAIEATARETGRELEDCDAESVRSWWAARRGASAPPTPF